jgi:hypothetical protein
MTYISSSTDNSGARGALAIRLPFADGSRTLRLTCHGVGGAGDKGDRLIVRSAGGHLGQPGVVCAR